MSTDSVQIELTSHEGLILESFLTYFEEQPLFEQVGVAERLVLYKLHALLEQHLDALQDPNYMQLLADARAAITATQT